MAEGLDLDAEVSRTRAAFYGGVGGGGACAVAAHLLAPMFSSDVMLRQGLILVFFGGLATAAWSFTEPFSAYLRADWRWRYAEAGPDFARNVNLLAARISGAAAPSAWAATAAALLCMAWVMSFWPMGAPLAPARELLRWGWIAALALAPLATLTQSRRIREAHELRRAILDEADAADIRPRTAGDAARRRAEARRSPVEIARPLVFRAGGMEWRWSDFYKNAAVFGQTGSGKTICVLNALLDGLVSSAAAARTPPAGLVLDPKGDFRDKLTALARRHGWERRLAVIDPRRPDASIRWNPLDSADDATELAGRFAGVLGTLSESSDKDRYFIDTATTFLRHMIVLLRATTPDRSPALSEIYDCASSDDLLGEVVSRAPEDGGTELRRAEDYMRREWRHLATDTKSIVRSFLSNMLGPFLSPPYDTLFAGRSTLTIRQAIEEGRIIYVDLPLAEAEIMSRVVATFVKLEFYREVLRSTRKERPSFFFCDEFQAFFTVGGGRGDADAFERTRQSNHANIIAFQNINALYKQTDRKEQVENLLGNCATQVFLRNFDHATNEYASRLFGQRTETQMSVSANVSGGARQGASSSVGGSAQTAARIREDQFGRLLSPSQEDGVDYAEAMTHFTARTRIVQEKQRWRVHPITS